MGNAQSPATDQRFIAASRAFSKEDLEDLRSLFASLAAQSQSDGKFISQSVFQVYYGVQGALAARLFQLVSRERKDGMLTFEDLIISKATYERGTRDEVDEFIFKLCDVNGDGALGRDDLESILKSIEQTIFTEEAKGSNSATQNQRMEVFLNSATFSNSKECMSQKDLSTWCCLVPSVRKFLGSLLMPPDPGRPGFQVPKLDYPPDVDSHVLILKEEFAWHIGGALTQQEAESWKLLYHSSIHGLSFNTFLGKISTGEGPTILVIRDKEGYIYGGYASQPWERHSDFYGDMKSFLFQLTPKASIFRPTGANTSIQWCGVGFSSDSIPNGVGFGGKPHHFGLYLSANFDGGHTFSCTTFNSPSLSKLNYITPDVIECWGIQLETGAQNEDNRPGVVKGTVLERFKEDRNMLKLVGLASSSD
ncbi:TLD domain-containing protein 1 [Rhynchospora pubera]|uniref:TLD domain-containing protein 1 n=1 Tax=Rhynchospora pubera TaxID=906938 RepID=A0AAV8HV56_9POAL|nr:TLD domain-containing protein 1 [Rhynchospora pubera]